MTKPMREKRYNQCRAIDPKTRKRCYKIKHSDNLHQSGVGKGVIVWEDEKGVDYEYRQNKNDV